MQKISNKDFDVKCIFINSFDSKYKTNINILIIIGGNFKLGIYVFSQVAE